MTYTFNASTRETEHETSELETSLGKRENPVSKEKTTYHLLTTKQIKSNGKERHSSVEELAYLKS